MKGPLRRPDRPAGSVHPQSRSHGQVTLRLPQLAAMAWERVRRLGDALTAEGPPGALGPSSMPCQLALMQPPSWPVGPERGGRAAGRSSCRLDDRGGPAAPHHSPSLRHWAEKRRCQPAHPSGILATPALRSILQLPIRTSTPLSWAPCALPSVHNGFILHGWAGHSHPKPSVLRRVPGPQCPGYSQASWASSSCHASLSHAGPLPGNPAIGACQLKDTSWPKTSSMSSPGQLTPTPADT